MRSTDRVIPYARNPRKISDAAVAAVAGSIKEFGFKSPIVVDKDGVIIAGHTRLRAAQRLGMSEVPVVVADDLTPAQVKAYRIADNRVAEFSEWATDMLKIEVDECEIDLAFADLESIVSDRSDFAPGTEEDQHQLDKLKPVLVRCPECNRIFNSREHLA
jgi:hypothetical protein